MRGGRFHYARGGLEPSIARSAVQDHIARAWPREWKCVIYRLCRYLFAKRKIKSPHDPKLPPVPSPSSVSFPSKQRAAAKPRHRRRSPNRITPTSGDRRPPPQASIHPSISASGPPSPPLADGERRGAGQGAAALPAARRRAAEARAARRLLLWGHAPSLPFPPHHLASLIQWNSPHSISADC